MKIHFRNSHHVKAFLSRRHSIHSSLPCFRFSFPKVFFRGIENVILHIFQILFPSYIRDNNPLKSIFLTDYWNRDRRTGSMDACWSSIHDFPCPRTAELSIWAVHSARSRNIDGAFGFLRMLWSFQRVAVHAGVGKWWQHVQKKQND